ncbi:MAG TPA: hypothetical protein PKA41_07645 [Verrucomicrobiota bacterium]|nr:hypothetical protein [Verrucomicrobiota bacterium]
MKARVILIASLCVNAGLVAAYFTANRQPQPLAQTETTETVTTAKSKQATAHTVTETVVVAKDFNWATVEAEDYKQYIANLRAIGCPEETIADIIIADVNKLYGARMAALRTAGVDFKFWQVENRDTRTADRERQAQIRELEREKRDLIKELLGIDLDQELARWEGREDADAWRYGFLSAEKQEQVRALRDKYRDLERALRAEGGGPETRAKMLALRTEQEAEMARLLTPAEYQEYQLRNSFTARNMRENLGLFEPTESEFREIFALRKSFDDQYGGFMGGGGDEATREARRAAEQQLQEQLKAMLGEQRYKEYQMAQDNRYRDIYNYAQQNNLSDAAAQQVYDIRVAAEAERNRLRNNSNLTPEQREVELAKLALSTSQALSTVMGADASKNYVEGDGRWVTRLIRTDNQRGGDGGGDFANRRARRGGP